jgi:putative spermidine/putrescine transport system permease protein
LRRPTSGRFLIGLVLLPIIVPPVTSAVALYFLLAQIGLLDTIPGLVLSHVVMIVPFAVIAILGALSRLDRNLELAARNLGASQMQSIIMVILPNIRFGLFAAWFVSLVMSWEESSVTLFVSGVNVITLPKRIWDNLRLDLDPAVAAISVIMILATTLVILLRKSET